MRALNLLSAATKSPGQTAGGEAFRSATAARRRDRPHAAENDSKKADGEIAFEDSLNGLVAAACTLSAPAVATAPKPHAANESPADQTSPELQAGKMCSSAAIVPADSESDAPTPPVNLPANPPVLAAMVGECTGASAVKAADTMADNPAPTTALDTSKRPTGAVHNVPGRTAPHAQQPEESVATPPSSTLPVVRIPQAIHQQAVGASGAVAANASRETPPDSLAGSAGPSGDPRIVEANGDSASPFARFTLTSLSHERSDQHTGATDEPTRDLVPVESGTTFGEAGSLQASPALVENSIALPAHGHARDAAAREATFADQISSAIATRVETVRRDGRIDFRLRLDPPGMGTVQVHLAATEHSISAQLIASDSTTQQTLESQLHVLRDALAGMGISLENVGIARDNGMSRESWQWQRPEPPFAITSTGTSRAGKRSAAEKLRLTAGVIDVVV